MELLGYLRVVRRRWRLLVLTVLACLAGAVVATQQAAPVYESSIRLLVPGGVSQGAGDEITQRQLAIARAKDFSAIVSTATAITAVQTAAGLAIPLSVSSAPEPESAFFSIRVRSSDRQSAQAAAAAYPRVLPRVIQALDSNLSGDQLRLSVASPASLPSKPVSPKPLYNLALGLVLGLGIGLIVAVVREAADRTLRDVADIEDRLGQTLLGTVPEEHAETPVPTFDQPRSRRTEAYRKVRTNLLFSLPEGELRSIVVTSAEEGEGKTTFALNLAITSAKAGQRVVLVDADLRRPMVSGYLGVEPGPGLSEVLMGTFTAPDVLVPVPGLDQLAVMRSGALVTNPSELLGSSQMATLVRELEGLADLVIIDAPPVLPVADAVQVASLVSGVVVVARVARVSKDAVRRAVSNLAQVEATILGVVANGVSLTDAAYGYDAYYSASGGARRRTGDPAAVEAVVRPVQGWSTPDAPVKAALAEPPMSSDATHQPSESRESLPPSPGPTQGADRVEPPRSTEEEIAPDPSAYPRWDRG